MAVRQGVCVRLHTADGAAIDTRKHDLDPTDARCFSAKPGTPIHICVGFRDDFDLYGSTIVMVVLAVGHKIQPPGSLDDVQYHCIRSDRLIDMHTFTEMQAWKNSMDSQPVGIPLTVPRASSSCHDEPWRKAFNASNGSIAVFVIRGHCPEDSGPPSARARADTDPPAKLRHSPPEAASRVIRWEWFEPLDREHGQPLVFQFHNVEEVSDHFNERAVRLNVAEYRRKLETAAQTLTPDLPTHSERKRRASATKETPSPISNKRIRQENTLSSSDGDSDDRPITHNENDDQINDEIQEQKESAPRIRTEVKEVPEEDFRPHSTTTANSPPTIAADTTSTCSRKQVVEEDEEMLQLRLKASRLKQQRRKLMLKKQDPNIDLDEDEEMIDMQLEENELEQTLRRKQLE